MSCAFCGMPPRDGEPCCTSKFKAETMRRADARISTLEREKREIEREREEMLLFVRVTANYPNPDAEWAWNRKRAASLILSRLSAKDGA